MPQQRSPDAQSVVRSICPLLARVIAAGHHIASVPVARSAARTDAAAALPMIAVNRSISPRAIRFATRRSDLLGVPRSLGEQQGSPSASPSDCRRGRRPAHYASLLPWCSGCN
jgi:hypothetical protein